MTVNRVLGYYTHQAFGKDMAKKQSQTKQAGADAQKTTHPENESSANGLARITPAAKAPAGESSKPTQLSDQYISTRKPDNLPVRNEKVEHARSMMKQGRYNDPQVIEEIINRLVQAIKE